MKHDEKKSALKDVEQGLDAGAILSEEAFYYYKGLVGQIEIALPKHSSRVLLFSSSLEEEGTTEIVVGLGLMLALGMGRRTAIVDGNFNHPDLHTRFGTEAKGLGDYLAGRLPIEQALVNTTVPNLHILPLGDSFSSFSAYTKEDIERFISTLRARFDYVLVDSAPVGLNPESTILCDKVDAVVMVVRHGRTRREVVRRTKETIERAGGRMLGVILNRRKFPIPEFLYRRL